MNPRVESFLAGKTEELSRLEKERRGRILRAVELVEEEDAEGNPSASQLPIDVTADEMQRIEGVLGAGERYRQEKLERRFGKSAQLYKYLKYVGWALCILGPIFAVGISVYSVKTGFKDELYVNWSTLLPLALSSIGFGVIIILLSEACGYLRVAVGRMITSRK